MRNCVILDTDRARSPMASRCKPACRLRDGLAMAGIGFLAAALVAFAAALGGVDAAAETFLGAVVWAFGLLAGAAIVTATAGCGTDDRDDGVRPVPAVFRPTWGADEGGCHG